MAKDQQLLVQSQVFGEKQILKMADFLQSVGDPSSVAKLAGLTGIDKVSSAKVGASIDKTAGLNDLADALQAGREFRDATAKANAINESMIRARDKSEQVALDRENQRIQSYKDLAALNQTAEKIFMIVDQGVILLGSLISKVLPFVDKMTTAIDKLMKSPMIKGVKGLFGGGGD